MTLNLSNYANDPNGDPLIFTKVDRVGSVLGTTYTYEPGYDEAGIRFSKLQASDGVNPQVEAIFYIYVNRFPNQITNMKPLNGVLSKAYLSLVFSWNGTNIDGDLFKYDFYHIYSYINVYIYVGSGSGATFGLRWIGGALRLFVMKDGSKLYLTTIALNT